MITKARCLARRAAKNGGLIMVDFINFKIIARCSVCDASLDISMLNPAFSPDSDKDILVEIEHEFEHGETRIVREEKYQDGLFIVEPCENGCKKGDPIIL